MNYIKLTIKNGKNYGFTNKEIIKEIIKGAFKGYNKITEI